MATTVAVSHAAATSGAAAADGTASTVSPSIAAPSAAAPQRPRAWAYGSASAIASKRGRLDEQRRMGGRSPGERAGDVERVLPNIGDADPRGGLAPVKGSGRVAEPCDDRRHEHRDGRLRAPGAARPASSDAASGNEPQGRQRREHRAEREQESAARLPPGEDEPAGGEGAVEQGEARARRSRAAGRARRARAPGRAARAGPSTANTASREPDGQAVRVEGQLRRRPAGEAAGEQRSADATGSAGRDRRNLDCGLSDARPAPRRRPRRAASARARPRRAAAPGRRRARGR